MTHNIDHRWRTAEDIFTFLGIKELGTGQKYVGKYKSPNQYQNLKAVIKYSPSGNEITISVHKPNLQLSGHTHIKYATFNKNDNDQWSCTTATNFGHVVHREYNKASSKVDLATRVSRLRDRDDELKHDQLREAFRIETACAGSDYNDPQGVIRSIQNSISRTQEDGGSFKYQESSIIDRLKPINRRAIPY